MSEVAANHPEDHEAQIFYALAVAAGEDPTDKTYAGRLQSGRRFSKNYSRRSRLIPGWRITLFIRTTYHHWLRRHWRRRGVTRRSRLGRTVLALDTPSQTFTRRGYWQEAIDTNIAAAAAARREGQTAEELHATDYEIYAYLQTAQDAAAGRVLEFAPRQIAARFDPNTVIGGAGGPSVGYFALAAIPARYALERQDWKQATQLVVKETPFMYTEAMTWFARGYGAARMGQAEAASE